MNAAGSKSPTPRRRWYQVDWRILVLVGTLLAAAAWPAAKILRTKAARARVAALGGRATVFRSAAYSGSEVLRCYSLVIGDDKTRVVLTGGHVTDAALSVLDGLGNVCELRLDGSAVTDAGLRRIGGHKELTYLSLINTAVGDDGLAQLDQLTNLRELDLSHTRLTDAGLRAIG